MLQVIQNVLKILHRENMSGPHLARGLPVCGLWSRAMVRKE